MQSNPFNAVLNPVSLASPLVAVAAFRHSMQIVAAVWHEHPNPVAGENGSFGSARNTSSVHEVPIGTNEDPKTKAVSCADDAVTWLENVRVPDCRFGGTEQDGSSPLLLPADPQAAKVKTALMHPHRTADRVLCATVTDALPIMVCHGVLIGYSYRALLQDLQLMLHLPSGVAQSEPVPARAHPEHRPLQ